MSPGASVRSARTRSRRSSTRSKTRRTSQSKVRRRSQRRRRALVIGGTLIVGALGGFVLANSDRFQRSLEEVTLPLQHEDIIRQQAAQKDVPADLIAAVIYTESRFRDQTSHAGARGLMQITPATAKVIESLSGGQTFKFADLANPDINIRYGTFYLHYLIQKFGDNEIAALAAYNAGETNVSAWGGSSLSLGDIPFPETRDYVENVLAKRGEYARHYRHELGLD
ncbi:MAG: soluble lytic murein transglycosylase [Solirubrobacterales bacterium]|jgi:soluble lytic murein transglycosylase|nr:soluble lytic murein transglycosylase [Solirubrobacterales bacterium]